MFDLKRYVYDKLCEKLDDGLMKEAVDDILEDMDLPYLLKENETLRIAVSEHVDDLVDEAVGEYI